MKRFVAPVAHLGFMAVLLLAACQPTQKQEADTATPADSTAATPADSPAVSPAVPATLSTDKVPHDTDDPAIWVHPTNPDQSIIIGTDKGDDGAPGGLYAFDLQGKMLPQRVSPLQRPNNVDLEYGFVLGQDTVDIAVVTERGRQSIRVFTLPNLEPIDGGGLPVFKGQADNLPMGITLYKEPQSGHIYAFVGRKSGPENGYVWQYRLEASPEKPAQVQATLVRQLGQYSGAKEIESLVADDALGYLYYSDETVGVRKYYAHPDSSGTELALFATSGVARDHEGLSIYPLTDSTGYLLLSDQQANKFHVFARQGTGSNPHAHPALKVIAVSTSESDGSDVTAVPLNAQFDRGLFVAMSDDGTFQYYRWQDLADSTLEVAQPARVPNPRGL